MFKIYSSIAAAALVAGALVLGLSLSQVSASARHGTTQTTSRKGDRLDMEARLACRQRGNRFIHHLAEHRAGAVQGGRGNGRTAVSLPSIEEPLEHLMHELAFAARSHDFFVFGILSQAEHVLITIVCGRVLLGKPKRSPAEAWALWLMPRTCGTTPSWCPRG